jgi:hypothetical protein
MMRGSTLKSSPSPRARRIDEDAAITTTGYVFYFLIRILIIAWTVKKKTDESIYDRNTGADVGIPLAMAHGDSLSNTTGALEAVARRIGLSMQLVSSRGNVTELL